MDPSHYNEYGGNHSMIKGKKKTDTTLSAIIIEDRGAKQLEEEKHDRRKSKVSYVKSP